MNDAELLNRLRTLRAQLYNPPVPLVVKSATMKLITEMRILETIDACIERLTK